MIIEIIEDFENNISKETNLSKRNAKAIHVEIAQKKISKLKTINLFKTLGRVKIS